MLRLDSLYVFGAVDILLSESRKENLLIIVTIYFCNY